VYVKKQITTATRHKSQNLAVYALDRVSAVSKFHKSIHHTGNEEDDEMLSIHPRGDARLRRAGTHARAESDMAPE